MSDKKKEMIKRIDEVIKQLEIKLKEIDLLNEKAKTELIKQFLPEFIELLKNNRKILKKTPSFLVR